MTPCFRLLFSNRHRRYSSPLLCSIKAHCTIFESNHYFSEPGELVWKQPELSCSSPATKYIYVICIVIFINMNIVNFGLINDLIWLIWFDIVSKLCTTTLLYCIKIVQYNIAKLYQNCAVRHCYIVSKFCSTTLLNCIKIVQYNIAILYPNFALQHCYIVSDLNWFKRS